MLKQETINRPQAAAMARQVGIDFGASLTVALAYIGDRLGIFKLMAAGEPMTLRQIAERSGLDERYIREWASTMAAAGYVGYKPPSATFQMNSEQAMVLAQEDNTFFTGGAFQYAVACYRQIDKLMDAFRNGGGVPFADFGPEMVGAIERLFHAGYEAWVANQWIPAVPDLKAKLDVGAEVAEVGCGAGQCIVPVTGAGRRGLGSVIGQKLARELVPDADFSDFQLLPVKNPYHQIFAILK